MAVSLNRLELSLPGNARSAQPHHLVICFLLLVIIGCSAKDNYSNVELSILGPGDEQTIVEDIRDIQELASFDIVLPEDLPLHLRMTQVSVRRPTDFIEERYRDRHVEVMLEFSNEDSTVGFQLTERWSAGGIGDDGIRTLHHEDTVVEVVTANEEHQLIAAVWAGCDIGFFLLGGPSDQLNDDHLMSIVESTLECQEIG